MKLGLTAQDKLVLELLGRIRGVLAETLTKYSQFNGVSAEALRKRLERLCQKAYLAKSDLPSGRQLFRLSQKGARMVGAPAAWADSPSGGAVSEALSVSALAHRTEEFLFLSPSEWASLLGSLSGDDSSGGVGGRMAATRFLLRPVKTTVDREFQLHYLLSELRPAADLGRRVEVIVKKLTPLPVFQKLAAGGLFGITIAVPSDGVRSTLENLTFPLPTQVVVVEELKHLFVL